MKRREKAEEKTVWTELSVCLCLCVSPLDGRVKGHEEKSRRRRRRRSRGKPAWMKFSMSCHYEWTLTDHRVRERERDTERKTRRWRN